MNTQIINYLATEKVADFLSVCFSLCLFFFPPRNQFSSLPALTEGCCTVCCGSELHLHMFWSKSQTLTRSPNSHRGPEAAGWISRCNGPWSTTKRQKERKKERWKKVQTNDGDSWWFLISSLLFIFIELHFAIIAQKDLKWKLIFSPPSLGHTLFHPPEGLSWFYRSTGCRGDCTTAACRGRRFETKWGNSNFEPQ